MEEKIETWKRNESKRIADCRVFTVREDFCETDDGAKKSSFFVVENPDWVNIIALTKDKQVVLIEQFRHGIGQTTLEIPGGMVDDGEDFELAARRELVEETGFLSDEWVLLGKSRPNPAIQNNWIYHFLALNCEKNAEVSFDEHESAMTKLSAVSEIKSLILNGEIKHSLVIAAFYFLELKNL
jgi:ADP-ribose pyrophosphatase